MKHKMLNIKIILISLFKNWVDFVMNVKIILISLLKFE